MSDSTALDSFLDKWRARWPEWQVAETFVPAPRRRLAVAWFALLQEFEDAMNIAGDPLPADAKLGWWGEELRDWSRQRSRHPLGRVLEPCPAPWEALAGALPALAAARAPVDDIGEAFSRLRDYAQAVAAVEASLFDAATAGQAANAIAAQTLAARLAEAGPAALAGSGNAGDDGDRGMLQVGEALLKQWPLPRQAPRERRIWAALARQRLQRRVGAGQPVAAAAPLRLLLTAWWAGRG
ncbi:phytoene/squalene synthase family protein [Pseudoxanthomonas wuyuanensis]|uniref:phytoene/squalene synthase family protein n=1 Tax=Pseudoxanthomonas wuyuanensis TaxID=1073196 RepID=UPI001389BFCA|nr:phytoene/squalene synthase family protein [Pseudoxanthomonas wuyuanensis]KAF1721220.1 phytoene/squalene synthase family protein [Pseudoxanthomonas wuyuanensis]